MSQALHILKKDAGHLRLEIGFFLALTVAYAWAEYRQSNQLATWALLAVAAVYLIARAVHAEAIPGDSQFWISRPYRWKSLLSAKLLFILLFVNLPVFVARLAILLMGGFPLASIVPGLLWSQFLILLVFCIPIAAIAALTRGLVPFIFSMLLLLGAGLGIQTLSGPLSLLNLGTRVNPIQWVWDAMAGVMLAAAGVAVVWIQYKSRSTRFSRALGISVAVATIVAYLYLPWPVAFAIQTHTYTHTLDASKMHVVSEPRSKRLVVGSSRLLEAQVGILFPITGIPEGMTAEANSFVVELRDTKGRSWKSDFYHPLGTMKASESPGHADFAGYLLIPRTFLNEVRDQSLRLSGSIYLTLFGSARSKTVQFIERPVAVIDDRLADMIDGLQCGTAAGVDPYTNRPARRAFYCRSPFQWPRKRVDVRFDASDTRTLGRAMSYSPFPAELSLQNVAFEMAPLLRKPSEVTVTTREPIKSIRLDFEVPDVRILEYVGAIE